LINLYCKKTKIKNPKYWCGVIQINDKKVRGVRIEDVGDVKSGDFTKSTVISESKVGG
jgi:hypothetical protein